MKTWKRIKLFPPNSIKKGVCQNLGIERNPKLTKIFLILCLLLPLALEVELCWTWGYMMLWIVELVSFGIEMIFVGWFWFWCLLRRHWLDKYFLVGTNCLRILFEIFCSLISIELSCSFWKKRKLSCTFLIEFN